MRCIAYLADGSRCESEADDHRLCDHCRARMCGRKLGTRKPGPVYCDRCSGKLRRRKGKLVCRACMREEERRLKDKARIERYLQEERDRCSARRGHQNKPCAVCPLCAGMSWAVEGKTCRACGRAFAPEPLKPIELYATERKFIAIG